MPRASKRAACLAWVIAVAASPAFADQSVDMAATVGELVRLEATRALQDARRAAGVPVGSPAPVLKKTGAPANTDVVELLGIYVHEGKNFTADVAINGQVAHVKEGEYAGGYQVKALRPACAYLMGPDHVELTRCVSAQQAM